MKKFLYPFLFAILATAGAKAQDTLPLLRHEMTPAELLRKSEIGKNFVETPPPAGPIRNVAEFDRMQGALVRYPFGIPISLIKEMATDVMVTTIVASTAQKNTVISQYVANGVDTSHCNFLIAPSDSYWTRDYGPWFETDSASQVGIVDFPYNRPRPNDDEVPKLVAAMLGIPWYGMNISHTGGNYMTDGYGISSSTNLVWVENPAQTQTQIAQKMQDYLGITNYQVVPDPNTQSTIDHIDCWSKFLAPDRILIRQTLPSDPEYASLEAAATYWSSQTCSYGYPYRVFRVQTPGDQPYTNSVILNNKVLVPFMNTAWDDSARAAYEAALPGYEVIGFIAQPSTPWLSTDALHCRVMGIADVGLLYIKHLPLFGDLPCEYDYPVVADIIAASHQPVKNDSVFVHYRVNSGTWTNVLMTENLPGKYTGIIPKQAAGSTVEYYLSAADYSGRHETAPLIAAADPFVFHTVYTNLAPTPDTLWFITSDDCFKGKITQLKNLTAGSLNLSYVEQNGGYPWYVDSMSVASLPHLIPAGDSVAVRVKMYIWVRSPGTQFVIDTLDYTTQAGNGRVIIMINHQLLSGLQENRKGAALGSNYPNPFTNETEIPVTLGQRGFITLDVLDIRGLTVRHLLNGMHDPGSMKVSWDGRNDTGSKMSSGVYFYRLVTSYGMETRRMILLE